MAVNRLQIETAGIEPGETVAVPISLENDQTFYGFQLDIAFPEGLDAVQKNGNADVILSSRLDNSFQLVTNKLADGKLRILAFSTSHQAITGNSGALFYINVSAAEDFSGGQLSATNIRMVGEGDRDVVLPDLTVELGTEHNNHFYIQDFKIAVGETKTVSLILDNETEFTAFQTDLYLPEGISIVPNSAKMTSRGYASHSISMKSFSDGRTRIACLSPNSDAFRGNRGALLTIDFTANKDAAETSKIQMKNQIFVTPHVKEYKLPNSECTVTTERALVESITLEPTSLVLVEGNSQQLTATVLPTFASTKDIEWSSSAPDIATVSATGLVTALKSGDCVITAAAVDGSGVTATCPVTVAGIPVTSVTLNRSTATLKATETVQLSGSVLPANASNKDLVWTTSDEHIATVSESGLVTAVAVGEVTITATSQSTPDISATCRVSVVPTPVASITLSQTSVSLKATETVSLTATVAPETATVKDVTWTSDNPKVATVDENGVITAVAVGSTSVSAIAADNNGAMGTCQVTVIPTMATGIAIEDPVSTTFKARETIQLYAIVTPDNASDKTVTWTSSNSEIATVNESGLVSAVSVGDVTITATNSAGQKASINLTVERTLAESIVLNTTSVRLKVGEENSLTVSFTPATTTDKSITWSSSDTNVVTVSETGLIKAVALGESVITAKTNDGSNLSVTCNVKVIPTLVKSVVIDYDGPTTLKVRDKLQLSARVLPEDATDKTLTWKTQSPAVVSVDQNGIVTAIGLGEAWVGAFATGDYPYAIVNFKVVETPVSSIELTPGSIALKVGKTASIEAKISPETATVKALSWDSNDTNIATVDQNGIITAIAVGEAVITATATDGSGVKATCSVSVIATPAEGVTIETPDKTTLKAGESIKLNASVLPETTTDKTITWTSSNLAVATVDENGNVTAVGVGTVIISATTSNGKTYTIALTIDPTLAESVTLTPATASILIGESIPMVVSVSPATTTNKSVTWTSSNPEVASVDDSGNVTGLDVGNVEITATTADGSSLKAVSKISVNPILAQSVTIGYDGQTNLYVGVKAQLSAIVLPENTTDKSIAWHSLNPTVASVSETGLVTALAIGNVTITATTTNGQTAQIEFSVVPTPVSAITFDKTSIKLKVTETVKVIATIVPEDATNKNINWTSSNNSVVSVDADGVVTAIAVGEAVITATATDGSGVKATCSVSVIATPAEGVTIETPNKTTFKAGESIKLNATVLPETTTDKTITWTSSNLAVATVDENGNVTAVGVGTVIITATTSNGKTYTTTLTVEPTLATSLTLNRTSASLKVANTIQLSARFTPATTTNQTVEWSTSNESVAKVNTSGLVTAKALGTCVITATAKDGSGVSASCELVVGETSAESITISPKGPFTIKIGETVSLSATVLPETATDKSVSWLAQTSAVKVDQNGLVTGLAVGDSWVRATNSAGHADSVNFTVTPILVEEIEIENQLYFEVGQTQQIHAVVRPSNATNTALNWTIKDSSVASVDNNGNVTALKLGATEITVAATDGSGVTSTVKVNVIPTMATGIAIKDPVSTTFKARETIQLYAIVTPDNASDKTVTWTSSNSEIATVNGSGLVSAVSVGEVIITATNSAGQKASINLTVEKTLAESIVLNTTSVQLKVGEENSLTVSFTPATTTDKSITWSSSNTDVATVSETGLIKAVALGESVITAKTNDGSNLSVTCNVKVIPTLVESVVIDYDGPTTLKVRDKLQLSARVLPEDATNKNINWTSSNNSVVSVDAEGVVTAVAVGEAVITATATDGSGVFNTVEVQVEPIYAESLTIVAEGSTTLRDGETVQLRAVFVPENTTDKRVTWDAGPEINATIDENGLFTAGSVPRVVGVIASSIGTPRVYGTIEINVVETPAEGVTIESPNKTTLKAGESIKLNASVLPETTTDKSINWSTSDATIATVDSEGNVIAVGVGTVEITATTSNGKTSKIALTIDPTLAESITLTPAMASILIGESIPMVVSVSPATTTNKSVTWASSNPEVASVDDSGNVTGLDVGNVEITATTADGSSLKAVSKISVNPILAQSVTIGYDGQTNLYVGVKAQLSAIVLPENTTDKSIAWHSLNPTVASVSETGLVTALAIGNVTITATTTNGQTAQIEFSVVPTPVSAITFDKTSIKLKVTETVKVIATIVPEDATNKNINWTSSNNSVVSVDAEGVVTAVAVGEAVITATATDGSGVFNTVEVQVEPIYAESLTIVAEGSTTLRDGETVQLRAVFAPENTTDKRVTWNAGPEINATIDENGLFTAGSVPSVVGVVARSIGTPGVSGSIEINVIETPVESVEITSEPLVLLPGESKEVVVSVNPSTATDKTITWSVSDESIIKLQKFDSSVAVINAIAPGQAYLYAKASNGVNTSLMVTVNTIPVSEIILSKQELRLNVSETYQFEANVLPANASNKAIRWESSNAEIGTVDETGLFTAIAPGETVITCYATDESGVSTQCQTVIIQPVTSITLNEHNLELEKNKSIQLVATIEPVNATDKRVTWSSSEPEIVSVNEDGVIEALKEGEAIITVATLDGSFLDDECKVTVSINSGIEKITIDDIKVSVNGNTIVVELESSLIPVRLYMINGTEIPATSRINKQVFFSDLDAGYYIISLGKRALKIRV